jgi:hypothetical protein
MLDAHRHMRWDSSLFGSYLFVFSQQYEILAILHSAARCHQVGQYWVDVTTVAALATLHFQGLSASEPPTPKVVLDSC